MPYRSDKSGFIITLGLLSCLSLSSTAQDISSYQAEAYNDATWRSAQQQRLIGQLEQPVINSQPLQSLLQTIMHSDPAVLEALANKKEAQSQVQFSRSQRYPVFSVNSRTKLAGDGDSASNNVLGRVPVYRGGTISKEIARDKYQYQYAGYKLEETIESVGYEVALLYVDALRFHYLERAEQLNYQRHQHIVDNLMVVVKHDKGRHHELSQAISRRHQVAQRRLGYLRAKQNALAELSRFTNNRPNLSLIFDWRDRNRPSEVADMAGHPSLQAQQAEVQRLAETVEVNRRQSRPRIDLEMQVGEEDRLDLSLNWALYKPTINAEVSRSRAQQEAASRRVQAVKADLRRQLNVAKVDAMLSRQQIGASIQQIASATEVINLYELQFKIARRSLLDLLNAYSELSNAEVAKVNAIIDYQVSQLHYLNIGAGLRGWVKNAEIVRR